MTLEEAIQHCEEKSCGNSHCNQEHKQLAEWLKKLQRYEKALSQIANSKSESEASLRDMISLDSKNYLFQAEMIEIAKKALFTT